MAATDDDLFDSFLTAMAPEPTALQREMAERAEAEGFPIIGRAGGGVLQQLAQATGATRVFEFGSGFGYSATWFARALPDAGFIVLTEEDHDELTDAREYLARADSDVSTAFEAGDAMEAIERYPGPFDVVLIDHAKQLYADAFAIVRDKVSPGGVVIADNAISAGSMDTEGIMRHIVADETAGELDEMGEGIRQYLEVVREDDAFTTTVLPVGSGLCVSVKRRG